MRILITGGAGFIGSAVVRLILRKQLGKVAVLDAMTYAASPQTLAGFAARDDFIFYERDICDLDAVHSAFRDFRPDAVMHLAAESHVDRSIEGPAEFVRTNVLGTQVLLEAARAYWNELNEPRRAKFRFHHISTDEVFGSLDDDASLFDEETRYNPRSPYSASKAASDHLVRAYFHTYGLPVVVTNCSNNYGPYQFPEKLVPLMILQGLAGKPMPVYGDGMNVRDWLFVDDHAEALLRVLCDGRIGETYAIGGMAERCNLDVVKTIASLIDELAPGRTSRVQQITFVPDRPGHDRRYAIDCKKIRRELGWTPQYTFEEGLRRTVTWYLTNRHWWRPIVNMTYQLNRLGIAAV